MTAHQMLRDPAIDCELRPDREYDEYSAGHVVHPNGSLVGSLSREFLGAATRAVLAHWSARPVDKGTDEGREP